MVDQAAEIANRPSMAAADRGDPVVHRRIVGIDGGREMHPVIDRDLERLVIQPGQITENLDEIESDFGAEPQQTLELRIELRLAPDKLDLPATDSCASVIKSS